MSLLKVLIVTLLVLFPFGEIFRFNLGNNIYLKPLDIVAVLTLAWTTIFFVKDKSLRSSLKWYYFFFPIIGLIALLINSTWLTSHELLTSFLYLLRWAAYMSIFFAVIQFDKVFRKKIITLLLADGLVVLLLGYLQYFFYPSLQNLYYLGWDEHFYRMFSSFFDPNFVGSFFVLYLIFIAGFLFHNLNNYSKKEKFLYSSIAAMTLIGIFLTYSRSALLMLIVSGIIFFLLLQKKKFILYLLGVIIGFVILISPFFYIANINLFRVTSSVERLQTAQHALKIIQDHPIIGIGFDSYRYAQERYHFTAINPQFQAHSAAGEDTSLLFVFATTGIIGLVAYLYLWFQLVKKAKLSYRKNRFALIFIASTAGLFINALFINSLFYPEIMLWMWLMAGLMKEAK